MCARSTVPTPAAAPRSLRGLSAHPGVGAVPLVVVSLMTNATSCKTGSICQKAASSGLLTWPWHDPWVSHGPKNRAVTAATAPATGTSLWGKRCSSAVRKQSRTGPCWQDAPLARGSGGTETRAHLAAGARPCAARVSCAGSSCSRPGLAGGLSMPEMRERHVVRQAPTGPSAAVRAHARGGHAELSVCTHGHTQACGGPSHRLQPLESAPGAARICISHRRTEPLSSCHL